MTATIIGGLYQTNIMVFVGAPSVGAQETGICLVPNATAAPITVTNASFAGAGAFSVVFGQFPVTVPSGSSVVVQVVYTTAIGLQTGVMTLVTTSGSLPSVNLTANVGTNTSDIFPSLIFPGVKVGQSLTFPLMEIVNPLTTSNTTTALGMTTGTDFAITGAPAMPFTQVAGAVSAPFNVVFTPTTTGLRSDSIFVTNVNGTASRPITGTGTVLQSFDSLNPPAPAGAMLMAFTGIPTPTIYFTQQNNLPAQLVNIDCEEAALATKITNFGRPNMENQVLRIRGHYKDLGVAIMFITVTTRRLDVTPSQAANAIQTQTKTFSIGTAVADEWPRQFTVDFDVTGELTQISIGRNANQGPVWLIDYCPEWVPKGEVLEGV
jgi:hypothetical protein